MEIFLNIKYEDKYEEEEQKYEEEENKHEE